MAEISIPNTSDVLVRLLGVESSDADLSLPLRALQMRGFSKLDLVVFIERIRERNAATEDDELVEENCLTALDMVHGLSRQSSLMWDAQHEAASLLPRCLTAELIAAGLRHATTPSDMLPPRPRFPKSASRAMSETLTSRSIASLNAYERLPSRAQFFRMPRGAFSTRPAALMELSDRIAFEALVGVVEASLEAHLPEEVLWPRRRNEGPGRSATGIALSWNSEYIVKADISNFYETIDHSLLAIFLIANANVNVLVARGIEALLTSSMGLGRGLPQGPVGSDVLASAYLLPLDQLLRERGVRFVRYADDYFFASSSVGEGRQILLDFEALLQELGLSLNAAKTQVMRRSTFELGLEHPSVPVANLKEQLAQRRISELQSIEDRDHLVSVLEEAGVDEETLFGLVYHRTIELDEVLASFADELLPSVLDAYQVYFHQLAESLEGGVVGDLSSYEMLARESIAVLSHSEADIYPADVARVVTWFPRIAPLVSTLLASGASRKTPWAKTLLLDHLQSDVRVDWVDAWMIHAAVLEPSLSDDDIVAELCAVLGSGDFGPMSQLESVRALGAASKLTEALWRGVFEIASAPVRSEMFFSAVSKPQHYPWLEGEGGVMLRRLALAERAMVIEGRPDVST
jgi:hypothetical protein